MTMCKAMSEPINCGCCAEVQQFPCELPEGHAEELHYFTWNDYPNHTKVETFWREAPATDEQEAAQVLLDPRALVRGAVMMGMLAELMKPKHRDRG